MQKDVTLTFHNQGLRSYIWVDLCPDCPRQDDKGCCGYYSPVFYPLDFAYFLVHQPELVDYILSLPRLTVLDASVTVNSFIDDNSGDRCQFHTRDQGCLLPVEMRESVCRHFVCPGIGWWKEESLQPWREFFERLSEYEISLNQELTDILKESGLTLREPQLRPKFFETLLPLYQQRLQCLPEFCSGFPPVEEVVIRREIVFGHNWLL